MEFAIENSSITERSDGCLSDSFMSRLLPIPDEFMDVIDICSSLESAASVTSTKSVSSLPSVSAVSALPRKIQVPVVKVTPTKKHRYIKKYVTSHPLTRVITTGDPIIIGTSFEH